LLLPPLPLLQPPHRPISSPRHRTLCRWRLDMCPVLRRFRLTSQSLS